MRSLRWCIPGRCGRRRVGPSASRQADFRYIIDWSCAWRKEITVSSFDLVVAVVPLELQTAKPPSLPFGTWELRITQFRTPTRRRLTDARIFQHCILWGWSALGFLFHLCRSTPAVPIECACFLFSPECGNGSHSWSPSSVSFSSASRLYLPTLSAERRRNSPELSVFSPSSSPCSQCISIDRLFDVSWIHIQSTAVQLDEIITNGIFYVHSISALDIDHFSRLLTLFNRIIFSSLQDRHFFWIVLNPIVLYHSFCWSMLFESVSFFPLTSSVFRQILIHWLGYKMIPNRFDNSSFSSQVCKNLLVF